MPLVSVIVPNFNGARHLPTCLEALRQQTFRDFEAVVVDDASTDESRALLARDFPEVRVVALQTNGGFVKAVNAGIRATTSPIVALLNNDTEAEPRWLEEICRPLLADPSVGLCASKLLLFDRRDVLHSAGDFYRLNGMPGNRGVWQRDDGQYDREEDVFGACGGAAAYRRSMLDVIGLFDEALWMYCEDVDISFRAIRAGFRCRYVPTARVYHRLSATGGGPLASYYCGRNFVIVYAKNMPEPLLRRHWPRFVTTQMSRALDALRHFREPAARAGLRGQIAGLHALPWAIRQRRKLPPWSPDEIDRLERLLGDQGLGTGG